MGACGSTQKVAAAEMVQKTGDQSYWRPDHLTLEKIKSEFPAFAKAGLEGISVESMSQQLEWGDKSFVDTLENAGSETGARLKRVACTWSAAGDKHDRPDKIIVKMTDVTEVPQMELLRTKSRLKRWAIRKLLNGDFLWHVIPRMILAECEVNKAALRVRGMEHLLPKLYFSKVEVARFPTQNDWVKRGIKSVSNMWTLQATNMILPPWRSANGVTGMYQNNGVEERISLIILNALAEFHAVNWNPGRCRDSGFVQWIWKRNPAASTLTFFYPMKFGLWPDGKELPDTEAPFKFGGDRAFCKLDAEKLCYALQLGIGTLCLERINIIRKLQHYLPEIQRRVCKVSDRGKKDCLSCQTILHGDAHAWNIFWNEEKGKALFIDLTNVGAGRVAWEVHYFISTSMAHDWEHLQTMLKSYYKSLITFRPGIQQSFTFQDFIEEYYLVALMHAAHHVAAMARSGSFTGKEAKRLRRRSTTAGSKGSKARKKIGTQTQQTESTLDRAADIFRNAEKVLFAS
eukprot:g2763.t1